MDAANRVRVSAIGTGESTVTDASTKPEWRNKVGKYPCGILEQAYRELKGTSGT